MTESEIFIRLSSILTGMAESELPANAEQQDPTGKTIKLADIYLQRLKAAYPAALGELVAAWQSVQFDTDPAARLSKKLSAADDTGHLLRVAARQIIKIWYLSTIDDPWSPLSTTGRSSKQLGGDLGQYQQSAIWKLIGAPVPGYSNLPHGYWEFAPR